MFKKTQKMDKTIIIKKCKELGCCDSCCLRFIGIKKPAAYENSRLFVNKFLEDTEAHSLSNPTTVIPYKKQAKNNQIKEEESSNKSLVETEHKEENSEAMDTAEDEKNHSSNLSTTEIKKEKPTTSEEIRDEKKSNNSCTGPIITKENVTAMDTIEDKDNKNPNLAETETGIENASIEDIKDEKNSNNLLFDKKIKKENSNAINITENKNNQNPNSFKVEYKKENLTTEDGTDGNDTPPAKRRKSDICVSCLGILQGDTWNECLQVVKEQLEKKRYECDSFACALSAPIANLLREKVITLHIKSVSETYDPNCVTPLKEAWKWSFGVKLESCVGKTLVSGTSAPLLITITMEYPYDIEELEILKTTSPKLFEMRRQQRKRFTIDFTRRSVEEALEEVTADSLQRLSCNPPSVYAKCVSVITAHVPCYLAGRYIKLSRELPQTPWFVGGKRMMESSVQEIIFEPVGKLYGMTQEAMESHLKLMSAGREDVDVRCLGEGRPFAIELLDPSRRLTEEELKNACEEISRTGKVIVKNMSYINKEDLVLLKKGEETKTKCYHALCIKLSHSENDDKTGPITVTDTDIANINSYRNTEEPETRVVIQQKTPIRVLHRRPLLTRTRRIHKLSADKVPGHPNLFVVRVSTEAGTYVKEWVHGELGRSVPALGSAMGARTDILALDVQAVNLPWPPTAQNVGKS